EGTHEDTAASKFLAQVGQQERDGTPGGDVDGVLHDGLDVHVQPHVVGQGRQPLLEPVQPRLDALGGGEVHDRAPVVQGGVVVQHERVIGGAAHIDLHPVRTR